MKEKIAVIGLGYVGLPVAVGFAKHYDVVGYDISRKRIERLRDGFDDTFEVDNDDLRVSNIHFTTDPEDMKDCTFFCVTVPTPIDENRQPDLAPLELSSIDVGKALTKGAVVVYESTVYPGVTEEFCGPILEQASGLKSGVDFTLGYSPERINPGDKVHRLETIIKVVSGQDDKTLDRVAAVYESIVEAGVHRAPSIKVAEAAKVIENTQRDLNIALMNELSLIFDKIGIRTKDVLEAAGTKWNFLKFTPGLVGGHCIGVDPYYLTAKAQQLGYYPQVILSGRRINDGMGEHVAKKIVKLLIERDMSVRSAKIGVLGLTFKEDVPDLRNSRVPDIIKGLEEFGVTPVVHDPMAEGEIAQKAYGIELTSREDLADLDALILAVPHKKFLADKERLFHGLKEGGVFIDIKSVLEPDEVVNKGFRYWSL